MREAAFALTLTLLLVAGCVGEPTSPAATGAPVEAAVATHVLANATEPAGLEVPTFTTLALYDGGPVGYGAGEPSVWAGLDGTLFVAFPGCDTDSTPGFVGGSCRHGVIYRSADDGASWERMNGEDGSLDPEGTDANGDADVTTDAAGNLYTSNLGGGIYVQRLLAGEDRWLEVANVVPEDAWADRQWMAAAAPGHLIVTWMGGAVAEDRQVAVSTTWNAGDNWTNVTYLGENIGWLGSVQFAPDGQHAYIPYTEPVQEITPSVVLPGASVFHLFVARTADGGATWETVDTGVPVTASMTGGHWSGVLMAPSLDVTGDGTLAYVWAEEVRDPAGAMSTGSVVKLTTSTDGGDTWSAPVELSTTAQAIMPWITGGAGDRIAVTYLASPVPGDADYAGLWDVRAMLVDGIASGAPEIADTLVAAGVHEGGACTRGGLCLLTGSDRALLDFFESDLLPDGRLLLAYPTDAASGGKRLGIHVAVQDGGSLLKA